MNRRRVSRPPPSLVRLSICAALLAASAARAGDNDLQLWRLGHPDDVAVCVKCDGTDRSVEPGDLASQARFARLSAALGLAFVPALFEPAATTGQAGFEFGFSGTVAFPRLDPAEWPTAGTQGTSTPPAALFLPTLTVRKGLGGSFELGLHASMLTGSQMFAIGAEVRWAALEGLDYVPDLGFRVHGTRVLGAQELDLVVAGADVVLSKSIGIAGQVKFQPYAQYGLVLINAASGVVDFRPNAEDQRDPTADDGVFRSVGLFQNRYSRFVLGFRVVAGVAVIGLEGSYSVGNNAIQSDPLSDGTPAPRQITRLWSASGRLGLQF